MPTTERRSMLDHRITLVSSSRETVDGVREYLGRAGARLTSTGRLVDAPATSAGADAIVLFADDFPRAAALSTFAALREALPSTVIVVVTEAVEEFSPAERDRAAAGRVVVLRRPAWGWMLLDALLAGAGQGVG
ncbi:MAG: hypothetical protein WCJ30_25000 [Deltaproteobacteria bacterium]